MRNGLSFPAPHRFRNIPPDASGSFSQSQSQAALSRSFLRPVPELESLEELTGETQVYRQEDGTFQKIKIQKPKIEAS
jgi:hypothetical protein